MTTTGIEAALLDAMRAAAAAVAPLVGRTDGNTIDGAAVRVLRDALDRVGVDGRVVVGEGEKDEAPMLAVGEAFGCGGPAIDIAVDPVDGTRLAAAGRPGAMVVIAAAPRGGLAGIGGAHYLDKLVTRADDPRLAVDAPVGSNLAVLAEVLDRRVADLRVAVQDRPRNAAVIAAVRESGARLELFEHGDIERSLRVLHPHGDLDLLAGIGGAPEGVITDAAARILGGGMRGRAAPQSRAEAARVGAGWTPSAGGAWIGVASITGVALGADHLAPVDAAGRVAVWSAGAL